MGMWLSKRWHRANEETAGHTACRPVGRSALVMSRHGSQYMDEDGDVAHEFYAEQGGAQSAANCFRHAAGARARPPMARVTRNLQPVGTVRYDIPRLNPDLPYIMIEVRDGCPKR